MLKSNTLRNFQEYIVSVLKIIQNSIYKHFILFHYHDYFNIFNMIFKIDVNFKIVEYSTSDVRYIFLYM